MQTPEDESREYALERVADSDIDFDQIAAFVTAEQSGGRLTKECLEFWFESNLRDNLTVVIADKLGFKLGFDELNETQLEVVGKHIAGYKGLIASLGGNKTMLSVAQINGLRRAFEVTAVDDDVTAKLLAKLQVMEDSHNNTLMVL